MRWRLLVVAAAIAAALLASCTSSDGTEGQPESASPDGSAGTTRELSLMEFNIEYGGEEVDFDAVIETIETSGADVVALEEAWGATERVARELGWDYFDPRTQLVSQLPLLAPEGSDGRFTYIELAPGQVAAIGNVHLPSSPYGPNEILDGAKLAEILQIEERVRVPAIEPTLAALSPLADAGVPTFLLGDFNAPSHLDYTQETVGIRDHVRYAVDWPVSMAVEDAGFVDGYRVVHPNPARDEGITWPASRPFVQGYNPGPNGKPADRIDFVYAAGPATPIGAEILGEKGAKGVDVAVSPWPTDHRATLVTFDVRPATPPTMVAVDQRLVDPGEDIAVTFHAPGENGERVVLTGVDDADLSVEQPTGDGSPVDDRIAFSTEGLSPGAYEVTVLDPDGQELSRVPVWIRDPSQRAYVAPTATRYDVGDPIDVEWRDAPGNRWDWLGIYKRGADPEVAYYINWQYTDATIAGTATFEDDENGRWPLKPGDYSVYLLVDDSYQKVAAGDFTVRK